MKHHPKRFSTILRLEQELLHNSYNLLIDSCVLFDKGSYPTAFALAVLAHEELGKLHLIDHVGFEACLSEEPIRSEQLAWLFSGDVAYSHRVKHEWAFTEHRKPYSALFIRRIEKQKQNAFYVGFRNKRIGTPGRVSATQAHDQIKRVVNLIKRTGDLPFLELFERSTAISRRYAAKYKRDAIKALSLLKNPRRKIRR
jgi:AbiV family abortive infection protein